MYSSMSNQNDQKTLIDIRGFLETSFIDWDGKVVSVVFVAGCNMRCPFCHNAPLVTRPQTLKQFSTEEIEAFMLERKDFIDGLCITGGEPTLHKNLPAFIKHFKDLGFLIKLDTNGTNPEMLKKLIDQKLVNFVAMDFKAPLDERYEKATGVKVDLAKIKKCVDLLISSGIDHEFRLTVVPGLISEKEIEAIGPALKGAKKLALQQFVPENCLDESYTKIKPYEKDKLLSYQLTLKQYVHNTILRGA